MATKASTTEKGQVTTTSATQLEKMYRMIIDFSGQEGLVSRYYGDYAFSTSQPQLSMNGGSSQYASGVVNPVAKYGYLSPANNTFVQVYDYTAALDIITTTEVDESNSFALFGDSKGNIIKSHTLTSTSLNTGDQISIGSNTYVTDMAFYSIGGLRKLFYAWKNIPTGVGDIGVWDLTGMQNLTTYGTGVFVDYGANDYVACTTGSVVDNSTTFTFPGSVTTAKIKAGMFFSATNSAGDGATLHGQVVAILGTYTFQSSLAAGQTSNGDVTMTFLPNIVVGDTVTGNTSGATATIGLDLNNNAITGGYWTSGTTGQYIIYTEPNSAGQFAAFTLGETVTGTTSGATGTISVYPQTATNSPGTWYISSVTAGPGGYFALGETCTGGTSGAAGIVTNVVNTPGQAGTFLLTNVSGTFTLTGETIKNQNGLTAVISSGNYGSPLLYTAHLNNFISTFVQRVNSTGIVSATQGGNYMQGGNTRLIVADNGLMYILDTNLIHYYDGTIEGAAETPSIPDSPSGFGSLYYGVVEFPPNYQLTDAIDYRGNLWITLLYSNRNLLQEQVVATYSNYSGVYIWNREPASQPSNFITVDGVREIRNIVVFNGVPTLFTISSTGYTEIRMWNGSQFRVVERLGKAAYPAFHDSIVVNGDSMTWLGFDGKVYMFGALNPESKPALWMIGDITTQTTSSYNFSQGGAILLIGSSIAGTGNPNPETYYLSMQDNYPAMQILQWFPHEQINVNSNNQYAHPGNYYSLVKPFPKLSQTHWLTLYFPPTGSGGSSTVLSVNIYINQNTTAWNASPILLTQDDSQRGYKTIPMHITGVNQVQIELIYPNNIGISSLPAISYASIDYDQTTKVL